MDVGIFHNHLPDNFRFSLFRQCFDNVVVSDDVTLFGCQILDDFEFVGVGQIM